MTRKLPDPYAMRTSGLVEVGAFRINNIRRLPKIEIYLGTRFRPSQSLNANKKSLAQMGWNGPLITSHSSIQAKSKHEPNSPASLV